VSSAFCDTARIVTAPIPTHPQVRDLSAFELAQACEALGAGEILLNCIDMDGQVR
jgi:imidazole glycerol phosphate synthase subunit HisF